MQRVTPSVGTVGSKFGGSSLHRRRHRDAQATITQDARAILKPGSFAGSFPFDGVHIIWWRRSAE
jgi:hypothetical protein